MATNEFLVFCNTDTGTNLLTESEYTASSDRTSGNKPGIASAKLNNKAIRQSSAITNVVAKYLGDRSGANVLDDGVTARLLAQFTGVMTPYQPVYTKYTSSTGTHNLTYIFQIASGSATTGATYTNNAITFTVKATVASAVLVTMTAAGPPAVSGTLTKASGTGDATLTFYSFRAPAYMKVRLVGGGGGGNGGGTGAAIASNDATDSTFKVTGGSALLVAGKGAVSGNANVGGTGGTASLGSGPTGIAIPGAGGSGSQIAANVAGGAGGGSFYGGAGGAGAGATSVGGQAAATNSGSGGGGAGSGTGGAGGGGGGSGGFIDAVITAPVTSYDYIVGAKGTGGTLGTDGAAGGNGGAGLIEVTEFYQ